MTREMCIAVDLARQVLQYAFWRKGNETRKMEELRAAVVVLFGEKVDAVLEEENCHWPR